MPAYRFLMLLGSVIGAAAVTVLAGVWAAPMLGINGAGPAVALALLIAAAIALRAMIKRP